MQPPSPVPTLETERLVLRAHRLTDFPDCAAMWADQAVVAHISGTPSTREQSWSRLLRHAGHWHLLGFGYWAVERRSDGAFLGEVGFADYRRDTRPRLDGAPEAGWVLCRAAHGRGYATEAVRRMLSWADAELEADRTVCLFDPAHAASLNVARKAGYGNARLGSYDGHETLFMERRRALH